MHSSRMVPAACRPPRPWRVTVLTFIVLGVAVGRRGPRNGWWHASAIDFIHWEDEDHGGPEPARAAPKPALESGALKAEPPRVENTSTSTSGGLRRRKHGRSKPGLATEADALAASPGNASDSRSEGLRRRVRFVDAEETASRAPEPEAAAGRRAVKSEFVRLRSTESDPQQLGGLQLELRSTKGDPQQQGGLQLDADEEPVEEVETIGSYRRRQFEEWQQSVDDELERTAPEAAARRSYLSCFFFLLMTLPGIASSADFWKQAWRMLPGATSSLDYLTRAFRMYFSSITVVPPGDASLTNRIIFGGDPWLVSCITEKGASAGPSEVLRRTAQLLRARGMGVARVRCWEPVQTRTGVKTLARRFGFRESASGPPVILVSSGNGDLKTIKGTKLSAEKLADQAWAQVESRVHRKEPTQFPTAGAGLCMLIFICFILRARIFNFGRKLVKSLL